MKRRSEPRVSSPDHIPSKRFGQNFLTDKNIVYRIIAAVSPTHQETIVEIGPGKGALTFELAQTAGRVIAIELDRNLVPHLRENLSSFTNFTLIEGDALVTDFCATIQPANKARVVANLPYNISTAILQRLIEQRACITEMVLMLQREVVERVTARPGSAERGYISVFVEAYCEAEKLFDVSPRSFRPVPKVWSTVLRLRMRSRSEPIAKDEALLWPIVSAGFAQRRKTILNNLRNTSGDLQSLIKSNGGASVVLCRAEIDIKRRAETLTLEEWLRITKVLQ
jgi:16S rRNA (adenine1518-N6/adenine1519-N6)-dimethyltransferase